MSLSAGKASVRIAWTGSDGAAGVARSELGQSTDGGPWTTVSTSLTGVSSDRPLALEHTYRFRVRAVDKAGRTGAWATASTFRLSRFSEVNPAISYTGAWTTVRDPAYLTGAALTASLQGAKASLTANARSVALVSRLGPDRGKANLYIDGTFVGTIDLSSATDVGQRVAWSRTWTTATTMTIELRVVGTTGRPRVDLDAFVTAN